MRLNFTRTNVSDAGMWRCDIRTESDQHVMSNGSLVRLDSMTIGTPIQHDIELIIIGEYRTIINVIGYNIYYVAAPPGQPQTLLVKESEATLFQICWEAPVQSDSHISYYLIRACNLNSSAESNKVTSNTISNETFYSVTGLLPGTTYELTVVAVSQGGDVIAESQPSGPIINTTGVTGSSITSSNVAASVIQGRGCVWIHLHLISTNACVYRPFFSMITVYSFLVHLQD